MIHPTAIIDTKAKIGAHVSIGPYTVIGPDVFIEDYCSISSHVAIGGEGEMSKDKRPESFYPIIISSGTEIREFTTVNSGVTRSTSIGPDCYIMGHSYIAHDCELAIGVTISHGASLGGHCKIMAHATVGLCAALHQHTTVGAYAMIAANATVVKDVMPIAKFIPGKPVGLNVYAIKKHTIFEETFYHPMPEIPKWDDIWWRDEYLVLQKHFESMRNTARNIYDEGIWS